MIYCTETHCKKIFTTGAFLQSMKVKDITGTDFWIWAVERFEDCCYCDGKEYHPSHVAGSSEKSLIDTTA